MPATQTSTIESLPENSCKVSNLSTKKTAFVENYEYIEEARMNTSDEEKDIYHITEDRKIKDYDNVNGQHLRKKHFRFRHLKYTIISLIGVLAVAILVAIVWRPGRLERLICSAGKHSEVGYLKTSTGNRLGELIIESQVFITHN